MQRISKPVEGWGEKKKKKKSRSLKAKHGCKSMTIHTTASTSYPGLMLITE
jgi:hypothetical protein